MHANFSIISNEPAAPAVRQLLGDAEIVVASDLTLIECDRVLQRAGSHSPATRGKQRSIGSFVENL
jgi:hypothetical protein